MVSAVYNSRKYKKTVILSQRYWEYQCIALELAMNKRGDLTASLG